MRSRAGRWVLGILGAAAMVAGLTVDFGPSLTFWSGVAEILGAMNQDFLRAGIIILGLGLIALAWLYQNRGSRRVLARVRGASEAERVFLGGFTALDQAAALGGPLMPHVDAAYQLLADGILTPVPTPTPEQAESGIKCVRLSDQAIDALNGFICGKQIKRQAVCLNLGSIGYRLGREAAAKEFSVKPRPQRDPR